MAFLPILVIFGIVGYLVYMGAFLPVPIEERNVGPFHFIYREINGKDFSLVGNTTREIGELLKQYNFSNVKSFQIFYPEEEKKLSEVGFIVLETVQDLDGVKIKSIPENLCMTTTFPFRSSFSFVLGFMKVDPALKFYRQKNSYKKTEAMVCLDQDTIQYMQPIVK
ncbi:MAG TPA: hypothetical protein PK079_12345 [Leptospiraceae bacterium]|nr:hypothetical protein [Leptospiraceae bacterium]HMW05868.1 hypothetical protein [Leptospiraceae bacterium]HMX33206.1 hypothetical protein [Leptospiraceae bacterium]HMY33654.1 hypothetical protein [Leptospiraceae bacterium]HMZ64096.1 hypothetical protein [Leptospiraceae bacterium]